MINMETLPEILGESTSSGMEELMAMLFTGTTMFLLVITFVGALVLLVGIYVYNALALQRLANKFDSEHSWFAWIPFFNIYLLLEIAGLNPLLVLLFITPVILTPLATIPVLNFLILIVNASAGIAMTVVTTIAYMNLCEKRHLDKMLGLISLINIGKLILIGVLAWGKDKE